MSTRYSRLASLSFIMGSRLCPPATRRELLPSRSNRPMAWSTLVARWYSNGAGTCMPNSSLLGRSVCVCRRPPRQQTPKGTLSSLEPTKPSLRCLLTSRSPLPMLPDMVGPIWLNWPFAGLMVISALYHAGRLVAARQCGRTQGYDDDLTHLVMSTAMAAMLVTSFGSHVAMAWSVVIGVPTLWFILRSAKALTSAGRSLLSGGARALIHPMQQVPMGAAMLFMLVVAGRSPSAAAPMAMDATAMPGMAVASMAIGGDLSPVSYTHLTL